MSSNRGRTLLALGLIGVGVFIAGCSSARGSAAAGATRRDRDHTLLVLGARRERGLTVQADRVAQGILGESGGPAIVIVPTEE